MVEINTPDWLWDSIDRPDFPSVEATQSLKDEDQANRLNKAYARCFSTAEGQVVLSHLRQSTLDRALGPDSNADALRQLEGQRQLVLRIEQIVKQATQTPV